MQQAREARGGRVFFLGVDFRTMATPVTPIVWCLVAAALFGASTPAAKALLAELGPFQLAGLFYLGAAIGVLPFSRRGGSHVRRRELRHRIHLGGAILAGGVAGPVLLLLALRSASAGSVSLWLNLEAVATAVLGALFFREHLGARAVIATGAVVAGGVLLALPEGFAGALPAALVALACTAWAVDNHLTALIDGLTPAQCTLAKGAVAGTINLAIGVAGSGWPSPGAAAAALAIGTLAYGASIVLYVAGAQQLGATRAQLAFATAPIAGLILAWTALAEPILPAQIAAAGLMALGVVLLLSGEHRHLHHHERQIHSHSHRHDDGHHLHVHPGLPAWMRHTHEHEHTEISHTHAHVPDLHHRHDHGRPARGGEQLE